MSAQASQTDGGQEITVESLANELARMVDKNGLLPEEEQFEITVEYETNAGNKRSRTGDVWAYDERRWCACLRFSKDAGKDDEDAYYIRIDTHSDLDNAVLVSVAETRDVNLGRVTDISVER